MMRQRGFTLIEMLIALMIGTIVAASLTLITRSMAQSASNEQMMIEASQAARAGIDILRFDFMRTGMFYSANPRSDANVNSLVSSTGSNRHQAYLRNPIVHLNNAGGTDPDTVILVGNFIGDRAHEGMVDVFNNSITILSSMEQGLCEREFNGAYAFAHLVTATGQTHDVKVGSVTPPQSGDCSNGFCTGCILNIVQGELVEDALGERTVKVAANQAALYRVESLPDSRNVLMRYFIDYSDDTVANVTKATSGNLVTAESAATAMVIAENVVDFQVWFRPIDPRELSNAPVNVTYYDVLNAGVNTLPPVGNVLAVPAAESGGPHLPCPSAGGDIQTTASVIFPEHVRSAIISVAVRTERTDQFQQSGGAASGTVVGDELAPPLVDSGGNPLDVGNYKVRRYTVEVKLPNMASQMGDFQFTGAAITL